MVNDVGDWVTPHLEDLYRRALENAYWRSRRPGLAHEEAESSEGIIGDQIDLRVSGQISAEGGTSTDPETEHLGYVIPADNQITSQAAAETGDQLGLELRPGVDTADAPEATGGSFAGTPEAIGDVKFRRWRPGDAIDKPLPSGAEPTWGTVRSRYWKNRHAEVRGTIEFSKVNLARMKIGRAPHDFNGRTGQWEPRELHHVIPRRAGGKSIPLNLRELRQDWHSEVDAFRNRPGIRTSRGIR